MVLFSWYLFVLNFRYPSKLCTFGSRVFSICRDAFSPNWCRHVINPKVGALALIRRPCIIHRGLKVKLHVGCGMLHTYIAGKDSCSWKPPGPEPGAFSQKYTHYKLSRMKIFASLVNDLNAKTGEHRQHSSPILSPIGIAGSYAPWTSALPLFFFLRPIWRHPRQ